MRIGAGGPGVSPRLDSLPLPDQEGGYREMAPAEGAVELGPCYTS